MSYVTTILIIDNYCEESVLKEVWDKIIEFAKTTNYRLCPEYTALVKLKEQCGGDKCSQFGDLYFYAFNYFPVEDFEKWFFEYINNHNTDIQILIKDEHDDKCHLLN